MNKFLYFILAVSMSLLLAFSSCSRDDVEEEEPATEQNETHKVSVTGSAANITYNSAYLSGWYNPTETVSQGFAFGIMVSTDASCTRENSQMFQADDLGDDQKYTVSISGFRSNTTYYYRSYALQGTVYTYGDVLSFKTMEWTASYVDLGLSVKWATCNVGANSPEGYGDYFAWGETTGYNSGKTTFDFSTYKWCKGSNTTMTKYCTESYYGTVDNKTVLDATDDAATANWGSDWRMPTQAEWQELIDNCTWTWTQLNGVNGYKVTSKKSGYTDKSIFLPAAGCRFDARLSLAGSNGGYWSGSLYTVNSDLAWYVYFHSDGRRMYYGNRYCGQSIRPVYG